MNVYRRIAFGFVFITAFLLLAVLYASLVSATIRVTPTEQQISSSFLVDVSKNPVREDELRGRVLARTVEISESFELPKEEGALAEPKEGKASGIVTVYNDRSIEQTLVATTRFLSESGVLFRLEKTMTVSGKTSKEARIVADQPGAGGDVGPSKFTIPGLSESLQAVIYAESKEPMTGGLRYVRVLTEKDLEKAEADLKAKSVERVREELREAASVFDGEAFFVEVKERASDTAPGAETDRYTVRLVSNITGVFFDEESLYREAERGLYDDVAKGLRPVGVSAEDLRINVDRADVSLETATLKVELSGTAIPSAAHEALSRGVFAGMTSQEVVQYFEENNLAKTVEVELRPSWRRRVPRAPNKIKIIVNEP
ncbi:hypothetical protein HYW18_01310 [Candidatus Uhrbacteria bacterium]|nr:hypothetical protein [Candidatus Uhrbacteria bacterium]